MFQVLRHLRIAVDELGVLVTLLLYLTSLDDTLTDVGTVLTLCLLRYFIERNRRNLSLDVYTVEDFKDQ